MKKILLCASSYALIIFLIGCTSSNVDKKIYFKKISIPVVSNKTLKEHIEADFTDSVIREFLKYGKMKVVDANDADIILKATIVTYLNEPLQYDANNSPTQYRLKIDIDIELVDAKTNKVIWTQEKIGSLSGGSATYFVRSDTGFDVQTEYEAQRIVYEKLAKDIVNRVIYGWENPK